MGVSTLGEHNAVTLGSLATAGAVLLGAWWWRRAMQRDRVPDKWVKIGEVGDLYLYPVKSLAPFRTAALECTPRGLAHGPVTDRMLMVVREEDGTMVTGREYPQMLLISLALDGTRVTMTAPDSTSHTIDFATISGTNKPVLVWRNWTEGVDCGDEAARWLSRAVLGQEKGLRVLYHGAAVPGKPVPDRVKGFLGLDSKGALPSDGGKFSDAASFHLINEASVRELDSRVTTQTVTALHFRPNLVVRGEKLLPFEEDHWDWVRVGKVVFRSLGPCGRCLFTTVDPRSATKAADFEPLATLRKYRMERDPAKKKFQGSPAMGIYLGKRSDGVIQLGDEVFVPLPQ